MATDVIIVGGGVIGCSTAWRLAREGVKVTVLERGRVGCEASRAAAGMLSPQGSAPGPGPFFDLCRRSRAMYRGFAAELKEASGIDVEYKDEGTLFVVLEGEDEKETTAWTTWQLEAGLPLERLSVNEIAKIEPAVTKAVTGAIFLPEEHQVENRRLMDALAVAVKRTGVELIEGAQVTALTVEHGGVSGVIFDGHQLEAGSVIVAAGTWSGDLLQPLGLRVNVIPALGQMIAIKGRACPIERVIHSSRAYAVPRNDGRILIGATVEYAGFHKTVSVGGVRSMIDAAIEMIPSFEEFELIETWAGLRPDTSDHLPVIGLTELDGLVLATGHFRNGILLAPITAELVSELVTSGRVANELAHFSVERFNRLENVQHEVNRG
ncbi:MAG: glycine oxidase ThiO [Blastocatellia bacterium]